MAIVQPIDTPTGANEMTIDQVIAAQEANELAARRCTITFAQFVAVRDALAKAESAAMAAVNARIAAATYAAA